MKTISISKWVAAAVSKLARGGRGVAQIFNLPYRRFAIGRPAGVNHQPDEQKETKQTKETKPSLSSFASVMDLGLGTAGVPPKTSIAHTNFLFGGMSARTDQSAGRRLERPGRLRSPLKTISMSQWVSAFVNHESDEPKRTKRTKASLTSFASVNNAEGSASTNPDGTVEQETTERTEGLALFSLFPPVDYCSPSSIAWIPARESRAGLT